MTDRPRRRIETPAGPVLAIPDDRDHVRIRAGRMNESEEPELAGEPFVINGIEYRLDTHLRRESSELAELAALEEIHQRRHGAGPYEIRRPSFDAAGWVANWEDMAYALRRSDYGDPTDAARPDATREDPPRDRRRARGRARPGARGERAARTPGARRRHIDSDRETHRGYRRPRRARRPDPTRRDTARDRSPARRRMVDRSPALCPRAARGDRPGPRRSEELERMSLYHLAGTVTAPDSSTYEPEYYGGWADTARVKDAVIAGALERGEGYHLEVTTADRHRPLTIARYDRALPELEELAARRRQQHEQDHRHRASDRRRRRPRSRFPNGSRLSTSRSSTSPIGNNACWARYTEATPTESGPSHPRSSLPPEISPRRKSPVTNGHKSMDSMPIGRASEPARRLPNSTPSSSPGELITNRRELELAQHRPARGPTPGPRARAH